MDFDLSLLPPGWSAKVERVNNRRVVVVIYDEDGEEHSQGRESLLSYGPKTLENELQSSFKSEATSACNIYQNLQILGL